jgi:WD40 repeat protein
VAISSDGKFVAYSTRGPTRVWDYRQQAERFSLEGKFLYLTVAFSPTEDILAVSSMELGLNFVDTKTGQVVRRFAQFPVGAYPVAFSPDGKRFAAAAGGEIKIIELDTEAEVVIKIPPLDDKEDR